jgi:NADPH-dependent glutamate synthase beta subunit-like oxidoreductase/ferredoxin
VKYIGQEKNPEAVAVIREKIPFPSVCGRVCFHPCESQCQRKNIDQPISIRVLKRWATEHDNGLWKKGSQIAAPTGKKAAVIGSGPAGLTAAYYLAKLGHRVTVFEALSAAGGMMRVGIPDYRLPKAVLQTEIDEIKAVGVEIKLNSRITALDELFSSGFQAVFVATGAHQGMQLGVEGQDLPSVIDCATFLREVALGEPVKIGRRVAVVGGGNAAIDAARVALRLGAQNVALLYRRTEAEMPANPEEIKAAKEENVQIQYLVNPTGITRLEGNLLVKCVRMQLGEPDASGRRRPEPLKGSEFTATYDTVIAAIGQRPEVPPEFKISLEKGNIQANPETLATNRPGVFAGGDAQSGPASVIEAIAAGRRGAISIDQYLGGKGQIAEVLAPIAEKEKPLSLTDKTQARVHPGEVPPAQRTGSFVEVEKSLTEAAAVTEAQRCLKCDMAFNVESITADMGYCIFCGLCVEACPRDALFLGYGFERAKYRLSELQLDKQGLALTDDNQRGGYCRPNIEITLPEQTLLINRDRRQIKKKEK